MAEVLWEPSAERRAGSNLEAFRRAASERCDRELADYAALHRWSIEAPGPFWELVWTSCGVVAEHRGETAVAHPERLPGARWFPEARLNFAENLLRRRDAATALIFRGEDRVERRVSYAELYDRVSQLAQWLRELGVEPGDRVAGYLPNLPEAVMAMLASASLGAVWSSCSPDFGVQGVVDRFGQIEPRVLFAADGYVYGGKLFDCGPRIAELRAALPSIEAVVIVPYVGDAGAALAVPGARGLDEALEGIAPREIEFAALPFDHPLYVLYSSGTTGAPKCIVHGAGGTLLQHLKEHRLHVDLKRDDRIFYFTTCGWMMWNWLVSALASEATLLLYDGSPFAPSPAVLFDFAAQERAAVFGTSAKFIDAIAKEGLEPARTHDLASLRSVLSTGSPLAPEGFDYVYSRLKRDVALVSMSGGTDIVACFVGGNPLGPVVRGEIQAAQLGMDVVVYDESGTEVRGEKGELVCRAAFPSVPLGFWQDPEGERFRAAYFSKFPGVWCQGDFAELTAHDGFVIYGRSDAVLNPGGVRIGTAEIYRQVERIDDVLESLAIGQSWDGDVRIVLFVKLRDGLSLDAALEQRIRGEVRQHASPRHVPARIVQVADLPRTKSGKLVELAVADVVHGRAVANREALANPEALGLFEDLPQLRS